jgi:hypothetical protein
MKNIYVTPQVSKSFGFCAKLFLAIILIASFHGCKKNSPGGNGNGNGNGNGAGKLLTKLTLVGTDAQNNVLESSTTLVSYDASNNIIQTQLADTFYSLDETIFTSETTNFIYGASLISSVTEAVSSQDQVVGQPPFGTTDSTYYNFFANGNQVQYFITTNSIETTGAIAGNSAFTIDSSLVTYDGNGFVSTCTVYEQDTVPGPYSLFYTQSFTYSGSNLAGYLLVNNATANQSTTTTTYTYNNHIAAAPFYSLVPGVLIQTANDFSEMKIIQTGVMAGTSIYTYSSSYNASNQPSLSSVLISTTPANPNIPVAETINYYYQ